MFPNLVILYPGIAKSLLDYRYVRIGAAKERARLRGYNGAMWPWESALVGFGVASWHKGDEHEIHIGGDIVHASRLYYYASGDSKWLQTIGWEIVSETANFYASRIVQDNVTKKYTFKQVICPDEKAGIQDDNPFTNAIASETMKFAIFIANKFKLNANPKWKLYSENILILNPIELPDSDGKLIHPEYTGYQGEATNQADVALLQYPLRLKDDVIDHEQAVNDLLYYQSRSSGPTTSGFFTGDSSYSIAWLRLGNRTAADEQFGLAFLHMDVNNGFNVWIEKSKGSKGYPGNLNFITGAGGYLQNYLYGYMGIILSESTFNLNPLLPPHGITKVGVRHITFHGKIFSVYYDVNTNVSVKYEGFSSSKNENGDKNNNNDDLIVIDGDGVVHNVAVGIEIVLKNNIGKSIKIY